MKLIINEQAETVAVEFDLSEAAMDQAESTFERFMEALDRIKDWADGERPSGVVLIPSLPSFTLDLVYIPADEEQPQPKIGFGHQWTQGGSPS